MSTASSFSYVRPRDVRAALEAGARPGAAYLSGGTTLVDLWKLGAFSLATAVDVNGLLLRGIEAGPSGLRLGAGERMSDAAAHAGVAAHFPVVSQALLLSASPQIRNMASLGGNLLQRPRSISYRNPDPTLRDGPSRFDAIFGVTPASMAVHPSDFAVALRALDGSIRLKTPEGGERSVKVGEFYKVPGDDLVLTTLRPGELIVSIEAQLPFARHSAYVKVRDRASYQFAIVSAAVALRIEGGTIREARVAAGGVGTIPWRLPAVEAALRGQPTRAEAFQKGVADIGDGSATHGRNGYKVELLRRTVIRALGQAASQKEEIA
ncbi:xanthine dehydrogenase YagS FAD-binding subunit [Verrucomicrobium sp. GAS474]|uniref:FAD binding domain-containing protein n=1 Tax=Verrucomicrobium sp. GAS474 TaxID=1882831 RepID=UPI00087B00A4|nr:xanthine dehydrogenase family protein subunit M [Verrucomicrobium sp. GAS474]SDU12021.1 xanthine dehydrogenase YagS FAD-binding subunit [Verrucomicrobium sp. GAS474]